MFVVTHWGRNELSLLQVSNVRTSMGGFFKIICRALLLTYPLWLLCHFLCSCTPLSRGYCLCLPASFQATFWNASIRCFQSHFKNRAIQGWFHSTPFLDTVSAHTVSPPPPCLIQPANWFWPISHRRWLILVLPLSTGWPPRITGSDQIQAESALRKADLRRYYYAPCFSVPFIRLSAELFGLAKINRDHNTDHIICALSNFRGEKRLLDSAETAHNPNGNIFRTRKRVATHHLRNKPPWFGTIPQSANILESFPFGIKSYIVPDTQHQQVKSEAKLWVEVEEGWC